MRTMRYHVVAVLVLAILPAFDAANGGHKRSSEDPVSERLISMAPAASEASGDHDDLDLNIESSPKGPFWLKPERMTRTVYAEPINQVVS